MTTWRDIAGWEHLYQVSEAGEVRSKDRITWGRNRTPRLVRGRMLKPKVNPSGYVQYCLSDGLQRQYIYAHRAVASAFLGAPADPSHEVCHFDGDRANNKLGNLRWDSRSSNHLDKRRHGTAAGYKASVTRCPKGHPYSGANLYTNPSTGARSCRTCMRSHRLKHRQNKARETRLGLD